MNGVIEYLPKPPGKSRSHWLIQAKPHVMTRLRRVFERISKTEQGAVLLADTLENARELLWFTERFPMEVKEKGRLLASAKAHVEKEARIQGILGGVYRATPSLVMALPPREYQNIAASLAATAGSLLLADDVGLGKTISAIATIAASGKLPALVVTLTHLPRQWDAELKRFLPELTTHQLKVATPYPPGTANWETFDSADVIICNYHKLGKWADELAARCKTVIFDEIQELRRAETNDGPTVKYAAAAHIASRAEIKLGLSATPIYNYGGEMFNVLSILSEDALGTQQEFFREWCVGHHDKASIRDPKAFGQYLRDSGLMLRRTRADVGRELANLTTIPYEVETNRKVLDSINGELGELARLILSDDFQERGAKFKASGELDYKLRRATGMAKAPFVADFVSMLCESGEKVVLYGWHRDVYDYWKVKFKDLRPGFFTGSESPVQKDKEVKRFIAGDTPLLILSLRAGAGLDGLQHVCRTVVFGELDWSPGVHEQAIGRVHRDGQTEPVCAYFLLSDSGSDPIIADTLGVKRGQIDGLRDPNAELVEKGADPDHVRRLAEEFLMQRGEMKRPQHPAPPTLAREDESTCARRQTATTPTTQPSPRIATRKPSFDVQQLDLFGRIAQ